uniref:Uncharacterized protein n=1 Tax=Siphoviridae sp. ctBeL15 TaxID=2825374 RepID=A0A8S5V037_9CAUD|nr:MAG TPA: Protein of unknown function (DUF1561) [Siphoviridae sp. ctBeL15]
MSFCGVCLVQSYSMCAALSTFILGNRSPIWVIILPNMDFYE